jgi:phosphogluconate dehydratase
VAALPRQRRRQRRARAPRAFSATGGLQAAHRQSRARVIKVSAVPEDRHVVEAPAASSTARSAAARLQGRRAGARCRRVVRFQGPRANGMPELHKLTPPLAVLQGKGFRVALVTDGRMSGASGKVPAAIHVSPRPGRRAAGTRRDGDLSVWTRGRHARRAGRRRTWAAARWPALAAAMRRQRARPRPRTLRRHARNVHSAEEGACTWL